MEQHNPTIPSPSEYRGADYVEDGDDEPTYVWQLQNDTPPLPGLIIKKSVYGEPYLQREDNQPATTEQVIEYIDHHRTIAQIVVQQTAQPAVHYHS